ncbi:MAG: hypothetical protein AAF298_10120 [Cyanobacteria bacterium P01_A01_bin.40]
MISSSGELQFAKPLGDRLKGVYQFGTPSSGIASQVKIIADDSNIALIARAEAFFFN